MAVTITIGGVDKGGVVKRGSLSITKDDAVETCRFVTRSADLTVSAYRPALGDVVRVEQDTELLFGGTVEEVTDRASDGLNAGATEVAVTAVGYHLLPEQVSVTTTYAAGADLLVVADDLCNILSTYYSVTNVGSVSGGPTLPAIVWDHITVAEALRQLSDFSGGVYQWRINGDKGFAMAQAGAIAGPAFTDSNAKVIRTFGWSRSRTKRATRMWAKVGTAVGSTARTQNWTGDGSRVNFYLDVDPSVAPTQVIEGGSTTYAVPSATWTYEATRNRLVRASALGNGVSLSATYTVQYPAWCRAELESEIDAGRLYEGRVEYPDVLDLDAGVALAQGALDTQSETPKRVTLQTREVGIYPWLECNLSFSARTISGDYLVRRVTISDALPLKTSADEALLYEVELWETAGRTWLDYWRTIRSGGSGGGIAGSGVTLTTGGASHVWGLDRRGGEKTASWTAVSNYLDWVAPTSDSVTVTVERKSDAGGTTVQCRIYDVTSSAAAVTGSATNATTWTEETLTFAPVAGHRYRLQMVGSNTSAAIYAVGRH